MARPASVGPREVFKGKKMAGSGRCGKLRRTLKLSVDDAEGIVLIHGAFPDQKRWVLISDAVKSAMPEAAPFPAGLMGDASEEDVVRMRQWQRQLLLRQHLLRSRAG